MKHVLSMLPEKKILASIERKQDPASAGEEHLSGSPMN
jgi:hypothetical protein